MERVVEYLDIPQEAPAVIEKNRPPAYWPSSSGSLHVEHLVVQYAPHLPPVLQNISFTIKPSEKIGVVCWLIHCPGEISFYEDFFLGGTDRVRYAKTSSSVGVG